MNIIQTPPALVASLSLMSVFHTWPTYQTFLSLPLFIPLWRDVIQWLMCAIVWNGLYTWGHHIHFQCHSLSLESCVCTATKLCFVTLMCRLWLDACTQNMDAHHKQIQLACKFISFWNFMSTSISKLITWPIQIFLSWWSKSMNKCSRRKT